MGAITTYVEVILPLPVAGTFCYSVPEECLDLVGPGKRVEVQFGSNRVYSAIVREIHHTKPDRFEPKQILSVLDDLPLVNQQQMEFWDWMSQYYLCHTGEVMNAALPSGLKLTSESKLVMNPLYQGDTQLLTDREFLVFEAVDVRKVVSLQEVSVILGIKKIMPVIKSLVEKRVVEIYEDLQERYIPKKEWFVTLSDAYLNEENLQELFGRLSKRSEKQLQVLMTYLHLSRSMKKDKVKQALLLKESDATHATMKAMTGKGIFLLSEEVVSRLGEVKESQSPDNIILSPFQEIAIRHVRQLFLEKNAVLLHGVTSSGKTEIYVKLIQETLLQGKQVLYLLPEIALTTQIIDRLRKFFGDRVGVYHSKYNEQEKVEIWRKVLQKKWSTEDHPYQVILGARSALFLPFSNLGLIIVDEEHDSSYKQHDPPPRYHARDAAIVLGRMHEARVLLGTATPSIESYFNARTGRYGLVTLTERYGGIELPEVEVVDMKAETIKKRVHSHYSQVLLDAMDGVLQNKEQVILFQNRRGFSLRLVCDTCQWTPECKNCDVTLTYHKINNELRCHYCGYSVRVMTHCEGCGGSSLKMSGFGTEKVEEELSVFFPEARIARMDLDSTRGKYAYQKILGDFESGDIDILVGTQMVTKGLDFDRVTLVGILNADNQLTYPDFRSYEKSFQLMAQVSGRSGRKKKRGRVIIQTWSPGHRIINQVIRNDYEGLYLEQLKERQEFLYPPYYRLILLVLKHKDASVLNRAAVYLAENLRKDLGKRVIGPEFPLVSRINQWYIKQILIKIEREAVLGKIKDQIVNKITEAGKQPLFKSVKTGIDVDPV